MDELGGLLLVVALVLTGFGVGSCTSSEATKSVVYRQCETVGMAEMNNNKWIECRVKK